METLYLVEPGISLKLEITPEVKEAFLKENTEGLTVVQRMNIITQLSNGYRENLHNGRGHSLVSESGETNLRGILQTNERGNDRSGENSVTTQNIGGSEPSSCKRVAIDPELNRIALYLSEMIFDEGSIKFFDYAAQMIEGIGEEVKPYLKGFYELSRYTPGMEGVEKMSMPTEVAGFNIDKFIHNGYLLDKSKSTILTTSALVPGNNESDTNTVGGNSPLDGSREVSKPTSEVGNGKTERPINTDRGQDNEGSKLGILSDQERG